MLGFVLILYFESLPTKTQLQFLSDTFLPTVKDYWWSSVRTRVLLPCSLFVVQCSSV